jgi:glutamate--cysteine ligase
MASELVIESVEACVAWIASGARPRAPFRVGSEYERWLIDASGRPVGYHGPGGVAALFERLVARYGWRPLREGETTIALERDGASISLEPAGQLELSGAAFATVTEMVAERDAHLAELAEILPQLGLRSVWAGMNPVDSPDTAPKVPKKRYDHMRAWMPRVGSRGLDMMHLTCTVQANLDFASAEDAMASFRLCWLMTPPLIALFANSPWRYGAPSGLASTRAWVWTDVDRARCEPGPWVFEPSATLADYVQWALDVPMYFVLHGEGAAKGYHAPRREGLTFRQFLADGDRGRRATLADWELHLSTLFPDVRLKRYIEVRAADVVPPALLPALPALCKGLLYDHQARAGALALLRDGDGAVDRAALRAAACRDGLGGGIGDLRLGPLAVALIDLARLGLERLAPELGTDVAALQALDAIDAIARGEAPPLWQRAAARLRGEPSLAALVGLGEAG